ncbi:hypothetical protein K438DRAFT_2168894 [Mycena galopus ATCC 62051]|nr:hypothetical protein K438DRAFT_2168894 [Mycena galopus ATCC 62051]
MILSKKECADGGEMNQIEVRRELKSPTDDLEANPRSGKRTESKFNGIVPVGSNQGAKDACRDHENVLKKECGDGGSGTRLPECQETIDRAPGGKAGIEGQSDLGMDDNKDRRGRRMNAAEAPGHCEPEVQWWSAAEQNTPPTGEGRQGWSPKELGRTLVEGCAVKEIKGYKASGVEPLRIGPAQRVQIELNKITAHAHRRYR